MKRILFTALLLAVLAISSGCTDAMRFAPTQQQKQAALLTNDLAKEIESNGTEAGSPAARKVVQGTTAAMLYYGLPKQPADPQDFETIVADATVQSMERPDPWKIADNLLVLGAGIATIVGGVAGQRIASSIGRLRAKAKALEQVVVGNDILKANGGDFKKAHGQQTPKTKTIVAEIRARNPVLKIPSVIEPPEET